MDELRKWLEKVGARALWTRQITDVGRINCYQIGKGVVLVQVYTRNRGQVSGWDLFVPASLGNDISMTLEAAELALGIEPATENFPGYDNPGGHKCRPVDGECTHGKTPAPIEFERDSRPMKIHKGIVIRMLREDPDCLERVLIDGFENAEEAISALEAHPAEWILDGVLRMPTPEELRAETEASS